MPPLFTAHPLVLETAYSELKRLAFEQPFLLMGTPGSVGTREVAGSSFLYRQFYDAAGKKKAEYLGPVADPAARSRADAIREQIVVPAKTKARAGAREALRILAASPHERAATLLQEAIG